MNTITPIVIVEEDNIRYIWEFKNPGDVALPVKPPCMSGAFGVILSENTFQDADVVTLKGSINGDTWHTVNDTKHEPIVIPKDTPKEFCSAMHSFRPVTNAAQAKVSMIVRFSPSVKMV